MVEREKVYSTILHSSSYHPEHFYQYHSDSRTHLRNKCVSLFFVIQCLHGCDELTDSTSRSHGGGCTLHRTVLGFPARPTLNELEDTGDRSCNFAKQMYCREILAIAQPLEAAIN